MPPLHLLLVSFVLCHASKNTTSRNIGGTDAWAAPLKVSAHDFACSGGSRILDQGVKFQKFREKPPILCNV